jgi:PAS domain S-box-containing protein
MSESPRIPNQGVPPDPAAVLAPPGTELDHFAQAFHASPALLMIGRFPDGVFIEINDSFLRASGYSRAEVIGRTALELGIWQDPGQRAALFGLLQKNGQVHDFEALFYTKQREPRYVLLNANLLAHKGENCLLLTAFDLSDRRRREQVQEATYQISRVLLTGGEIQTMFAEVQGILSRLMPARNFRVAMQSELTGLVSYTYFSDEAIPVPPPHPPENGLTEQVMRTGAPLLARQAELREILGRNGPCRPEQNPAAISLAVPLLIDGSAIGVISVHDYQNPQAYGEEEKRLLLFVAEQAAAAVRRQLSEIRQRESQAYFAKSLQTIPAVAIVARLDNGQMLEVNAAFESKSGYSRADVIGRSTLDLNLWIDPMQRDQFITLLQRDGRVHDFEGVFHTKFTSHLYLLLSADVVELNGIQCMLTIGMDITERRRREQVQEATYQISRVLLNDADLPELFAELHRTIGGLMSARNFSVALLSADGTALHFPYFVDELQPAPPTRARGFGLTEYVLQSGQPLLTTADELAGLRRDHAQFLPTDQPAPLWLGVPLLIEGRAIGVIAVQDYHDPRAYGEEEKRLLTFVAGQAASAVQRRETGEALQHAEKQYRGIFENALEGLYVSSLEGRFLRANPALARILGYASPDKLIAAVNDVSLQMYADANRRTQFLQLIHDSDEVTDFESEIIRPDGTKAWVTESVRVVRNAAGAVQHFEGVMADITSKREVARTLQQAKEVAVAANRAKSQFLASMSHELRTPLNGILGYTQILDRDQTLSAKQRDGVEVIHQSAEHLLALINDVLDLAKIEAGKLELHAVEFNLPEFAHTAVDFFAPRAREKNLRLESSIAPDLPRVVWGDSQRLRQVLFNLLGNAMKFTSQGAVIFTVERSGDLFLFSVSDTGPGISTEDQTRLFEPFSQVGDNRQHTGGTGLGLNVSRNIVNQMGGTLRVQSRPGWGARFWFEIALPEVLGDVLANRSPTVTRRVIGYEGPRLRVLVADDHAPNRTVLMDLLQPLGFDLLAAHDGQQAVEIALRQRPDVVLMDLRMPRLDGMAAAQAILSHYRDQPPCIIAVSASTLEGPQHAALAAGCTAFLSKPFFEEDLFTLLERHIGLIWRTNTRSTTGESRDPFPILRNAPAPAEANAIFELATKGDVMGVRAYAQDLALRVPEQTDFAEHIIELATNFRMKAIRTYVTRYRTPPAKP